MQKLPNILKHTLFFFAIYFGLTLFTKAFNFQEQYLDGIVGVSKKLMATSGDDILLEYERKVGTEEDFYIQIRSQKDIDLAMENARKKGEKTVAVKQEFLTISSRGFFYIPLLLLVSFIFAYPMSLKRKIITLFIGLILHYIILSIRLLAMVKAIVENSTTFSSSEEKGILNDLLFEANYIEFNLLSTLLLAMILCIRQKDLNYFLK